MIEELDFFVFSFSSVLLRLLGMMEYIPRVSERAILKVCGRDEWLLLFWFCICYSEVSVMTEMALQ